MKKNWTNPVLESLEIAETAGGPNFTEEADSDIYNTNLGYWEQTYGSE